MLIVLASPGVYGDPPVRPVLPAGTEIRIPGSVPFTIDEPHKLVDGAMRDSIVAQGRMLDQLKQDLIECNLTLIEISTPRPTPTWLLAIKYIGAGLVLAGAFALGMAAAGGG
jgi:hypothetical protein